ncbi:transport protein particle 20 kDa subunit [Phialemonium atrogriseum]|uniref:Transport protein particle 20 kDa subunit n=1 Tax=Phialemonium atrogriseum TaxID=1093897 RepID=A0AAJ0FMQ7_9PEZI|nr:transport protein particle 20 kDa subunit [Phialemonium atrogriseum]KAK1768508.1 transport protein particle 20 kDa subunit [Phialemonium atrogriseum]
MSYYFAIIGTQDNPLFEYEFGTSKQGGDGQPRFSDESRHLNQFVLHSSLDIVEEVQWTNGQMYLKVIDKFFNNYISCFMTGGNVKFLLLHQPTTAASAALSSSSSSTATSTRGSTSVAANPTSPQTEEAVKSFFLEVYENYIKAIMSPFYRANMEIRSPVFRSRVAAAGRKYL